jgi:hypothetical protein
MLNVGNTHPVYDFKRGDNSPVVVSFMNNGNYTVDVDDKNVSVKMIAEESKTTLTDAESEFIQLKELKEAIDVRRLLLGDQDICLGGN